MNLFKLLPTTLIGATALAMGLQACNVGQTPSAFHDNDKKARFSNQHSENIYNALVAELYSYYGELEKATDYYSRIPTGNDSLEASRRLAELAFEQNNDVLALQAIDRWIKIEPESSSALRQRAILYIRNDNINAAAKDLFELQKVIDDEQPGHGIIFVTSLVSLEEEKEKAYQAFKKYSDLTNHPTEAKLALSALALNGNKFEEAAQAVKVLRNSGEQGDRDRATLMYAKALVGMEKKQEALDELAPHFDETKNIELKLEYARLLIMNEQMTEALSAFRKLSTQYPDNADVYYTLGLLYLEQKQFENALPVLNRLIDLPGRRGEGFYFLGETYEGLQDYEAAIEAYQEAIDMGFYKEAQVRLIFLKKDMKGLDAALDDLQSMRETYDSEDDLLDSWLIEGGLYYEAKNYEKSLEAYKEAKSYDSKNIDLLYAESLVYTAMEDIPRTEAVLRELLDEDPENASALNALGYTLVLHTERFDEAKELIEKALEIKPNDPAITDSLGWVEYRLGNLEEAERLLRKAYDALPDPEVAAHLAEVLLKMGRKEEAEKMLKEMTVKHPKDEHLIDVKKKFDLGGA
jgi:tetratricopeptide (TPR) repeat protein